MSQGITYVDHCNSLKEAIKAIPSPQHYLRLFNLAQTAVAAAVAAVDITAVPDELWQCITEAAVSIATRRKTPDDTKKKEEDDVTLQTFNLLTQCGKRIPSYTKVGAAISRAMIICAACMVIPENLHTTANKAVAYNSVPYPQASLSLFTFLLPRRIMVNRRRALSILAMQILKDARTPRPNEARSATMHQVIAPLSLSARQPLRLLPS